MWLLRHLVKVKRRHDQTKKYIHASCQDEEERGAGRVLLASLEATKSETTRALASLAAQKQQATAVGLPASNGTLAASGAAAVDVSCIVASPSLFLP